MNFIYKILFTFLILTNISFANTLTQTNIFDKSFSINKGAFKIIEFDKMIKKVKVSDKEHIEIEFLENNAKPLQGIKIFAKELGHSNILITFQDFTSLHIDINVSENLSSIIEIAKAISPDIKIQQNNNKVILKGKVVNQKIKNKILDLFSKSGIDLNKDLVDLLTLQNPDKMIRVKLYAVEINNNKGLDLKNNWFVSSKNYMEVKTSDGYYNAPLNQYGAGYTVKDYKEVTDSAGNTSIVPKSWSITSNEINSLANNQRNSLVNGAIDNLMASAVSLTGGLTGAANYLGKYFNSGLTLNYLKSKGVANILDETTLLTLENKNAKFHAGGTIYIKVQTTTDTGVPSTQIRDINYGLLLDIKAQNIVNDEYINLDITTKSTQIDWSRQVDGIPSFSEKSIITNVVVGNKSTIVLGGLINSQNAKDIEKIPLLGDIPILGFLFTSKSFREGKSELVFFITPEIVNPASNNQNELFKEKTEALNSMDFTFDEDKKKNKENLNEEKKNKLIENNQSKVSQNQKKLHEQRVREILGY
ncbi:hypothetical protein [Poseidonibacter sp.]|uniref:hypothetical protein n=1 Tax=Poseidonibacter sp. TaxID=2321188 RepID=UPI00359D87FD